ncbi:hypothetical protein H1P_2070004 [Hyella patelloides LEGE 07179]|uniref:Uncharacterized protein n=1 Tax=Hyella patelloides LEGE 07179 TaxID=945734 RepID=A0A563VQC3_9CYAN|nr:hypothetical protein H1P_2070004 [Hyella patelloides LEGE 07179]
MQSNYIYSSEAVKKSTTGFLNSVIKRASLYVGDSEAHWLMQCILNISISDVCHE